MSRVKWGGGSDWFFVFYWDLTKYFGLRRGGFFLVEYDVFIQNFRAICQGVQMLKVCKT